MEPQRTQRNTLCPQKEFPLVEALHRIYEAWLMAYLWGLDKRLGLLINFHVVRLEEGIRRLMILRTRRGGTRIILLRRAYYN